MKSIPRSRLRLICVSLLSVLNFFVFNQTITRAGTLDPGFGSGGKATVHIGQYNNARKVFIQPDGKIVVAGETAQSGVHLYTPSPVLARYHSDGTLDTSFGRNGVVPGQFGNVSISDAAMQPDGKFVLVGGAYTGYNMPPTAFAVVRYNSNGTLDAGFGFNGIAVTDIGGASDNANTVVLLPGGKIMVAGGTLGSSFSSPGTLDLVRYNSNGSLDTTFGNGGILYYFEGNNGSWPVFRDMVLLPDGKLLATGFITIPFMGQTEFLARFNADGSFDTTFGSNGFIYPAQVADQITLQPDGKFIVTNPRTPGLGAYLIFALSRFNSNGSIDNSFGTNGMVQTMFRSITNVGNINSDVSQAILKSNGDIIAIGTAREVNEGSYFAVAQYNSSGVLLARTLISFTSHDYGATLTLQPDGKIVLAGSAGFQGGGDLAVARLTSITNDIRPYRRHYNFISVSDEITVYRPGTGGGSSAWYNYNFQDVPFIFGSSGDIIAPADYDDDGKADLAVFRPSDGTWYIANELYNAATNFRSIQWGAAGDIPVADDYDGDGKADVAVFRPSNGIWYILESQNNSPRFVQWGVSGDKPVLGDYDGDGRVDLAVFRPSNGYWYILRSSDNQLTAVQFGLSSDIPVQADYNGDHLTDIAVFRPSTGTWYTSTNPAINYGAVPFGTGTDIPVPADYNGDGTTDVAVWRPATRTWYIRDGATGTVRGVQWGASTDTPVPGH